MGFTAAQYQATINEINVNLSKIDSGLERVRQVVNKQLEKDPLLGPALKMAFNKIVDLTAKGVEKIQSALKAAAIPLVMNRHEDTWLKLRGQADGVATTLAAQLNKYDTSWKGIAGGAYHKGVGQQPAAAGAITTKATSIAAACTSIRNAAYVFYLALGTALASLLVAFLTASTVAGPIGAAVTFVIAIAVALLGLLLNLGAAEKSLQGASGGGTALPGNHWPPATTT
ncbi:hypothetical protein GCM10023085_11500 [Actinomadura viridis]|uniref:Uncharacterized protein YukE n=1 Tax=Actinomadura viridis TaxID=58110 RepID=A0A931DTB2_9ACTN|nr:hypothetical protein [Actinomadura viridis]MBG6093526.1 uncharacterized protein YukE [Actinomadura viridis]